MSRFERITLVLGFVSLFADIAAIITFAGGVWSLHQFIPQSITYQTALNLFLTVTGLFMIYGWFSVVWLLARHMLLPVLGNLSKSRRARAKDYLYHLIAALVGTGILLLPVASIWMHLTMRENFTVVDPVLAFIGDTVLAIIALTVVGACVFVGIMMLLTVSLAINTSSET